MRGVFCSRVKAGERFEKHCRCFQLMSKLLVALRPSIVGVFARPLQIDSDFRWSLVYPVFVRPTAVCSGRVNCYCCSAYVRMETACVRDERRVAPWALITAARLREVPLAIGFDKRVENVFRLCLMPGAFILVFSRTSTAGS